MLQEDLVKFNTVCEDSIPSYKFTTETTVIPIQISSTYFPSESSHIPSHTPQIPPMTPEIPHITSQTPPVLTSGNPESTTTSQNPTSTPWWWIVGGILIVVFGLFLACLLYFISKRRRYRNKDRQIQKMIKTKIEMSPLEVKLSHDKRLKLQVPPRNVIIDFDNVLGRGANATVYKGKSPF